MLVGFGEVLEAFVGGGGGVLVGGCLPVFVGAAVDEFVEEVGDTAVSIEIFNKTLDFGLFATLKVFYIGTQIEGQAAEFFGVEGTADCLSYICQLLIWVPVAHILSRNKLFLLHCFEYCNSKWGNAHKGG
jgi:hypothetical protein